MAAWRTATASVQVAAPAVAVWAAAVDWPGQAAWIPATTTEVRSADGAGVGSELVAFTGIGPIGVRDTMRVTVWDPPRRCVVAHTGRVVRGEGVFAVEPLGPGRARFTWSERLELPGGALGRAGWALVGGPLSRIALAIALRRFARWVVQRGAGSR